MKKLIPYGHQHIDKDDVDAASKSILSEIITRDGEVEAFEEAIANYCGARYATAFNSGSSALSAAYFAANLKPSDRVFSTPNTFIATVAAPFQIGAKPIFIDIDQTTGNIDLDQLAQNLNTPSTRGKTWIVPVHFSGIAVDMKKLDGMIKEPTAVVIEDAAHALGSTYSDGKRVGCCAFSQMTVFSFHPLKSITTGEGGMVTTNDQSLYRRLKLFRNNGIERTKPWEYDVSVLSGNYNITDFQAALGLSQLSKIDAFIKKRYEIVQLYRKLLDKCPQVSLFSSEYDNNSSHHLFVIQANFDAESKEKVILELKSKGIDTQVHYKPIYRHSFFSKKNMDISPYFPNMESYFSKTLTLPLYYDLKIKDVEFVVKSLKKALSTHLK